MVICHYYRYQSPNSYGLGLYLEFSPSSFIRPLNRTNILSFGHNTILMLLKKKNNNNPFKKLVINRTKSSRCPSTVPRLNTYEK